ncbi:MAG: Hsp20/alpha crystallin family protein [Bacteroidetes bacterium]|nr:Hsp20/alpha crystallin family protein [Bacteroidota bacterium]
MKSDIFHRDENRMIPEDKSLFNDNLLETIDAGFHLMEKDNQYIAEIEAKGLNKEDFNIDVADRILYVSGEHKDKKVKDDEDCYEENEVYTSFQQSFLLPEDADENSINAKMENGVLSISINKIGPNEASYIKEIPVEGKNEASVEQKQETPVKEKEKSAGMPEKEVFHSRSTEGKPKKEEGFFDNLSRKIKNIFK